MIARNPSHFGSYDRSPRGSSLTAMASIGASGGRTGRPMPSLPQVSEEEEVLVHESVAEPQVRGQPRAVDDTRRVPADQLRADGEAQLVEPSGRRELGQQRRPA